MLSALNSKKIKTILGLCYSGLAWVYDAYLPSFSGSSADALYCDFTPYVLAFLVLTPLSVISGLLILYLLLVFLLRVITTLVRHIRRCIVQFYDCPLHYLLIARPEFFICCTMIPRYIARPSPIAASLFRRIFYSAFFTVNSDWLRGVTVV